MTSHGRVLPALALLAIVLLPLAANAQAFVYDWGRSFGGVGDQDGGGIAVDASGNVVIAGSFWNTVDFGGGPLVSAGDWDVFVARLDAAGNHLWSRRFGDAGGQSLRAMSTDALGNIYLTGIFFGTIDFGGGPITSNGGYDVFLPSSTATATTSGAAASATRGTSSAMAWRPTPPATSFSWEISRTSWTSVPAR